LGFATVNLLIIWITMNCSKLYLMWVTKSMQ
jgi:hypothetical protein